MVGIIGMVLAIWFVLGGCAFLPTSYASFSYASFMERATLDPKLGDIPEENRAILVLPGMAYGVIEFGNKRVLWGYSWATTYHIIPSGKYNLRYTPYNDAILTRGTRVSGDFQAGRVYELSGYSGNIVDITPE